MIRPYTGEVVRGRSGRFDRFDRCRPDNRYQREAVAAVRSSGGLLTDPTPAA